MNNRITDDHARKISVLGFSTLSHCREASVFLSIGVRISFQMA